MKTPSYSTCSDPEAVGAFVEGRLGPTERTEILEHLDHCQRCRNEVAALAGFEAIGRADPDRRDRSRWWLVAAAALVAVIGATLSWRSGMGPRDTVPVAPLVAATAPLEYRLVEARLTGGFAWAEFRGPVRSSTEVRNSPARLKLSGAAGEVLERASRDGSARMQHAAAVASLLIEDPVDAIGRLRKVTTLRPNDAKAWSDLAAARYDSVTRFNKDAELPQALDEVNHALEIEPKAPEALFNRALIVQKLGTLEEAREAWKRYLEVDATTEWAREARNRLNTMPAASERSQFLKALPQLERNVAARDTASIDRFVERFPYYSRAWMEVETLGLWAESFRGRDFAEAQRQLAIARAVGGALLARTGEGLLADCVAAIDDASEAERMRLAEAHYAYFTGKKAIGAREYAHARRDLHRAVALFASHSTGGWLNARYHLVVANHLGSETGTSEQELLDLLARTAAQPRYKALRGLVAWEAGLIQSRAGRWPKAVDNYQLSYDLFDSLGERGNAAYMSALIGEARANVGRRDEAWTYWSDAFRSMSEIGQDRDFSVWLSAAVHHEMLAGNLARANALLDIEMRHGAKEGRMRALTLFRRAIVSTRLGNPSAATAALAQGTTEANAIKDADVRASVVADLQVAEGITFAATDPDRALRALSAAIEHYRKTRQTLLHATMYERARVLRNAGRVDEALGDLQAAVAELESQRADLDARDPRAAALDGVEQIYSLLAELLLSRGKGAEAFVAVDRAAAYGFYGPASAKSLRTLKDLQRTLGPGEMVVEYRSFPRELVIFVIDSTRFSLHRLAVSDEQVTERANRLDMVLRDRAGAEIVRTASSALYETLISPVRADLARARSITFVPDARVSVAPFNALFDARTRRWLLEDHIIRVAASALYDDAKQSPEPRSPNVAVIRPSVGQIDLPSAEAETAAIMQIYPRATLIEGREVSPKHVLSSISAASIIHYAGHTDSERDAGLVLRVEDGQPELLYGVDITRTKFRSAPMVILSGCRTLRGGAGRSDLSASVSRAFLLAGASSVIGTSWDIDDDVAAALFIRFHRLRAAGARPAAALRESQLAMLHDSRLHTADWASAQIIVRSLDL